MKLIFIYYNVEFFPHTKSCLRNRLAAGLSRDIFSLFGLSNSTTLIFSKYCLTLVSSENIGCFLALVPLSRTKAAEINDGLVELESMATYRKLSTQ